VDGRGFLVQRTKQLVQLLVENAALLGNGLVSARQRRIVIRRVKAGHFANKFFDCLAKDSFFNQIKSKHKSQTAVKIIHPLYSDGKVGQLTWRMR
jgi:hypothetical protein